MHNVLLNAIERGEIDTNIDRVKSNYAKEHLSLVKQQSINKDFYFDLFTAAFSLVSQR